MKKIVSIIILTTIVSIGLYAQNDSLLNSKDSTGNSDLIKYMSPLNYAFMMHEKTPWAFKFSGFQNQERVGLRLSYEHKLATSFSLNTTVSYNYYNGIYRQGNYYGSGRGHKYSVSIEPRWFYSMNHNMKNKQSNSNLSGSFIGLLSSYSRNRIDHYHYKDEGNSAFFALRWGIQQRIFKKAFMDIGLEIGIDESFSKNNNASFLPTTYDRKLVFNSFSNLGLFFTKDQYKLDYEKLCPVLKCYEEEKMLLKIDFTELLRVEINQFENIDSYFKINFNPSIALERKLGDLPLSINGELHGAVSYTDDDNVFFGNDLSFKFKSIIQPRWYYNLNKRILKGKSGNGLSANYIALEMAYDYLSYTIGSISSFDEFPWSDDVDQHTISTSLLWGFQRTLSDHLYLDFNVGIGVFRDQYNYKNTSGFNNFPRTRIGSKGGIGIGYRF